MTSDMKERVQKYRDKFWTEMSDNQEELAVASNVALNILLLVKDQLLYKEKPLSWAEIREQVRKNL